MIPEALVIDLNVLKDRGYVYDIVEEIPRVFIVFRSYQLPLGIYNLEKTDLLIFTTPYYPNAGFDMFWVDNQLLLKSNSIPQGANAIETYLGRSWRRFSYHPYNSKPWNPAEDSVLTFVQHVEQRLRKGD